MKFATTLLLLLSVLSYISYSSAAVCTDYIAKYSCVGEGEVCNQNIQCTDLFYCTNQGNSIHNGTCVRYAEENEDCSQTLCNPLYSCESAKCVIANNKQNNESCTQSYECMGNMVCTNGVCVLPVGGCSSNVECPFGFACESSNKTCIATAKVGDVLVKDQQCPFGSIPDASSKCVAIFSGTDNSSCTIDDMCADQLVCGSGSVCTAIPTPTSTSLNCLDDKTTCTSYETCICQGNQTTATNATCYAKGPIGTQLEAVRDALLEYVNCITVNQCVLESYNSPPNYKSCADEKCSTEWCNYQSAHPYEQAYNPTPESCLNNDPICVKNSSSMVQATISLIVLSILAALMF